MKNERRKAAIAAYKERKVVAGIYAVRCNPTGERWLGAAPNIATVQNRVWFGLQMGTSPHRRLPGVSMPPTSPSRRSNAFPRRRTPTSATAS